MQEVQKLFKLLLQSKFYDKYKNSIPVHSLDDVAQQLLPSVTEAHEKLKRDVTTQDVYLMYTILNPTSTTAARASMGAYLSSITNLDDIPDDTANMVYDALWRKECGRVVSEYGFDLIDGKKTDVTGLQDFLSKVGNGFVPQDFNEPIDTDPVKLFERLNQRGRWILNIPVLNTRVRHISPGQLIVLSARPEAGKTATIVNLIAGREGFAAQGATVVLFANEEGADSTAGRSVCCFNELSFEAVRNNPSLASNEAWNDIRSRLTFLHKPEITIAQLDAYVKNKRPDIVIVDQLDNITMAGQYESSHERIGAVYRKAREIAAKYECVMIAATQASAEAEGHSKVTFSMAANSKTDKAAAADLWIGVGKTDDASVLEEPNEVMRYFTLSKNKISGFKGTVVCKLIQDQSRLVA